MLIHVASMGFGQIPAVVAAAKAAGIRRAVFVSTTAVLTSLPVRSKPIRAAAEACVRDSGLDWTILRPTMIYGSSRDRNMSRLLRHLRRWRIAPIPGHGTALQQPVHVDDVAHAIVEAAFRPIAVGREYVTSGARPMTLRELIEHAADAIGIAPLFVPLPSTFAALTLRGIERLGLRLPIRAEQIDRLSEDKAFDHSTMTRDLGVRPRCFSEGIRQEAAEIGLAPGA
jgi:nucleoside-diphosphate-sugar epimerase